MDVIKGVVTARPLYNQQMVQVFHSK